ncbi:hypothetical protein KGQ20_18990 [Catenulispora sp. NF23]|uniref:Uncharacterized protein n=1 Tax=Catenulispora pinistramenti TaxID=2705254 RepID=A0ABS5L592_9ACTN|nr:hypothetical protein [Catenulispora pinistramenti]MBS2534860.1 hypothetical protein [Catenulispora pinistramenti]MBS2553384.1 hypothetical protein [Catenulispora pinistramenti]
MQRAGGGSWRIEMDDSQVMALVLWLRDAAGMTPDLDPAIPPLEPAVPVVPELAALADPHATAQWTGLWLGLWEGRLEEWFALRMLTPPGFELLDRSPELRGLVAAGYREASHWTSTHRPIGRGGSSGRALAMSKEPGAAVKQLEGELGRRANDFEFAIKVLPVAGRVFWLGPDGRLVVSETLMRDGRAFRALLHDVLSGVV